VTLLLLLSALLSALTGAGATVRTPQVAVAVSRTAQSVAVVPAKVARTPGAPIAAPWRLIAVAGIGSASTWRLPAYAPLYLSRRRE
jgi:hypothetical protein